MKKLILNIFLFICCESLFASPLCEDCDGFSAHLHKVESGEYLVTTVPKDKELVLLRAYVESSYGVKTSGGYYTFWKLKSGTTVIDGSFRSTPTGEPFQYRQEYPDGCLVVVSGESLYFIVGKLYSSLTILGYFRPAATEPELSGDLNGDGKVNALDFAILAENWLAGV